MSTGTAAPQTSAEDPVLGVLAVLALSRAGMDARLIEACTLIVGATGRVLLADKGFSDVEELTKTQRRKWRAEAKRLACAEVEVKLGLGVHETRILVGLACAPARTRDLVIAALDNGWTTWAQVKAFWQRCGSLPADAAHLVAEALFGTDPATAAKERLDPDGSLGDRPWQHAEYRAALDREAVAVEGSDVVAERARRRAAYAARRAGLEVHDDGTATLTITGPLVTLCAVHTRIERIARLLRKHGDPRTLDQLRADVTSALLQHGTLPLLDVDPDDLTAADLDKIRQIINALPAVQIQVVVPWDTLSGQAACPSCSGPLDGDGGEAAADDADGDGPHGHDANEHRTASTGPGHDGAPAHESPAPGSPPHGPSAPGSPGHEPSPAGPPGPEPPGSPSTSARGNVAEILGYHPAFISPGLARELALQPGTTFSRILTDPPTGRAHELSSASYRPDAEMRRQIVAADVYSRAPGSRHPMASCELDHVIPWGPPLDGPTSVQNIAGLNKRPHHLKTKKWWSVAINDRRDLTWTTLLGQAFTTRPHDYGQYQPYQGPSGGSAATVLAGVFARALDEQEPIDPQQRSLHPSERGDLDDRRDLANQALYAAIAERGPGAFLLDEDDHPGTGEHGGPLAGWAWVTHTSRATGRRRPGPPKDPQSVTEVLGMRREGPELRPSDQPEARSSEGQTPWERRSQDDPPPF